MFNVLFKGVQYNGLNIKILNNDISNFGDSAVFNVWCDGVQCGGFKYQNIEY